MFILESEMPTVLVRPNIQGNLLPALSNACNSLIAKTININNAASYITANNRRSSQYKEKLF